MKKNIVDFRRAHKGSTKLAMIITEELAEQNLTSVSDAIMVLIMAICKIIEGLSHLTKNDPKLLCNIFTEGVDVYFRGFCKNDDIENDLKN